MALASAVVGARDRRHRDVGEAVGLRFGSAANGSSHLVQAVQNPVLSTSIASKFPPRLSVCQVLRWISLRVEPMGIGGSHRRLYASWRCGAARLRRSGPTIEPPGVPFGRRSASGLLTVGGNPVELRSPTLLSFVRYRILLIPRPGNSQRLQGIADVGVAPQMRSSSQSVI